jgi:hypothetical protein
MVASVKSSPVDHKAIVIYPEYTKKAGTARPVWTVAPFVMSNNYDTLFADARKSIGCELIDIVECGIRIIDPGQPGAGKFTSFNPHDHQAREGSTRIKIVCSDNGDSFTLPPRFAMILDEEGLCVCEPKPNRLATTLAYYADKIAYGDVLCGKVIILPIERTLDHHYHSGEFIGS